MGINVVIVNRGGDQHPDWDWIRYGNDREFFYLLFRQELEWIHDEEGNLMGIRPIDVPWFRGMVKGQRYVNEDRYMEFCDILESDGQWILRYSP